MNMVNVERLLHKSLERTPQPSHLNRSTAAHLFIAPLFHSLFLNLNLNLPIGADCSTILPLTGRPHFLHILCQTDLGMNRNYQ